MYERPPNRNSAKLVLPWKAPGVARKAGEEMGEDIATWKELASIGGMEVRAVSGVIVIKDAKGTTITDSTGKKTPMRSTSASVPKRKSNVPATGLGHGMPCPYENLRLTCRALTCS